MLTNDREGWEVDSLVNLGEIANSHAFMIVTKIWHFIKVCQG